MTYTTYESARKARRKVMAVVKTKNKNGDPVFKWQRVLVSQLSEEEFLSWKMHWINNIRDGFTRCSSEIKKDLGAMDGGKEKLEECIRILNLKRKAAEIE